MVRYGKYSPNNPEFLGAGCGILGIGEYEEKRKLYNEERKHEFQQYLTRQMDKPGTSNSSQGRKNRIKADENLIVPQQRTDCTKHVSTQTEKNTKDVSTNTVAYKENETYLAIPDKHEDGPVICSDIRPSYMPTNISNYKKNQSNDLSSAREKTVARKGAPMISTRNSARSNFSNECIPQDSQNVIQGKPPRKYWDKNAVSYAQELRAQIEERERLKKELEERERQEALARDVWLQKEEQRAVMRQKEEESRAKAREDLASKRLEDFVQSKNMGLKLHNEFRHVKPIGESQSSTTIKSGINREKNSANRTSFNSPGTSSRGIDSGRNSRSKADMPPNERIPKIKLVEKKSQAGKEWNLGRVRLTDVNQGPSDEPLSFRNDLNPDEIHDIRSDSMQRNNRDLSPTSVSTSTRVNPVDDLERVENDITVNEEELPTEFSLANLGELRKKLKSAQTKLEDAMKRNVDNSPRRENSEEN